MNVWSVISVGEVITRGRDPTVPLSGGPQQIFAPTVMKAETVIECVGVYSTPEGAQFAAGGHLTRHPNHRVKIKVCALDAQSVPVEVPGPATCSSCGRPNLGGGMCPPCAQAHWQACREADPELLEELEKVGKT